MTAVDIRNAAAQIASAAAEQLAVRACLADLPAEVL